MFTFLTVCCMESIAVSASVCMGASCAGLAWPHVSTQPKDGD